MSIRRVLLAVGGTIQMYMDKQVARASAALSYFLMLTIFPMLICLYEMLGNMFPTAEAIISFTKGFLPENAVETIVEYLGYVTQNHNKTMLLMAIITMATSSAAAFRTIDSIMGEIRGSRRFAGPFAVVFSFIFSLVFLAAVYFAVIVMVTGNWFLNFITEHVSFISISSSWRWGRFILLFLLLFVIIIGIYRITAPKGKNIHLFTGAALASVSLVGISMLFSYFIGMSVKYSLIYGSLASVMILMFWLYICGNIVIIGNIVNVVLERV